MRDNDLDRMEAEAGCELPAFENPATVTDADRARRLLACDDPPRGADADLCRTLASD